MRRSHITTSTLKKNDKEMLKTFDLEDEKIHKLFKKFLYCLFLSSFIGTLPEFNHGSLKYLGSASIILSEITVLFICHIIYQKKDFDIPIFPKIIWGLLMGYNLVLIIIGSIFDNDYIATSFWGNINLQPAFFLPLFIIIGCKPYLFRLLFKGSLYYSFLFIPFSLISNIDSSFFGIMLYVILAYLPYLTRKWKLTIIFTCLYYFIICYNSDARTPAIRIIFASIICLLFYYNQHITKKIRIILFAILLIIPVHFFYLFITTGKSVFESELSNFENTSIGSEHSEDTRTFLYEEVLFDLIQNHDLLLGKGINGKYYSQFFLHSTADSEWRNNPEVGLLSILLKGGILQLILILCILLYAIWNSFVNSENTPARIAGGILLGHYLLLFIEDIPQYTLYCTSLWLLTGMCLSPFFTSINDEEFYELLNNDEYLEEMPDEY